jgi:hypothetical protein
MNEQGYIPITDWIHANPDIPSGRIVFLTSSTPMAASIPQMSDSYTPVTWTVGTPATHRCGIFGDRTKLGTYHLGTRLDYRDDNGNIWSYGDEKDFATLEELDTVIANVKNMSPTGKQWICLSWGQVSADDLRAVRHSLQVYVERVMEDCPEKKCTDVVLVKIETT